jgi:hypothetical protein
VTVVARTMGHDWFAVANAPLARTLYALDRVQEAQRIDALVAEGDALRAGYLHNFAVNAPDELQKSYRAWEAKLRRDPHGRRPAGFTEAEQRAILRRLALTMQPREVS